ncbi:unnamed protein product [Ilex paraguariensis]|uniref:Glycosyltransferase n=1 Tax=Ilex paraguariensis TaxID=185542 RepID=A0ABC8RAD9_9AQUA
MASGGDELNIIFVPYLSPGHMIPMIDVARLFAAHGVIATIITTPSNSLLFQNSIDHDINSGHKISIHQIQFPHAEVGLPVGIENFSTLTSPDMAPKLFYAVSMLQQSIEQVILDRKPDCIVSDMFFPWTLQVARQLGIPRFVFHGSSYFAQCAEHSVEQHKPYLNVESDMETFLLPELPHKIEMMKLQLMDFMTPADEFSKFMNLIKETDKKSYGTITNSFYELEHDYEEYYKRVMGMKSWSMGPVSRVVNRDASKKAQRGNKSAVGEQDCITWLNFKEHNSVLYICFGSLTKLSGAQLLEIAAGLEASGHQFMWVIRKRENDEDPWLPEGFEERMRESKKGFIIKGWAPQLLILDHPAIGGMVTHCGWNSILEGLNAGLPLITWPLFAEQFYNEKLVTKVLRIGVSVGVTEWTTSYDGQKGLVRREEVEKAVALMMGGGREAMEIRKQAKELGAAAKKAVENGGSSEANLIALINELKTVKQGATARDKFNGE